MSNNKAKFSEKRRLGNVGEDIACVYLKKQGFSIIERNYLRTYGEIDIVARNIKTGLTHFIEVKSVSSHVDRQKAATWDRPTRSQGSVTCETDSYRPEDNMHLDKIKRLKRVIQAYIFEKQVSETWKFDLVLVYLNMRTRKARVEVLEDIIL
jgi:putative endonuclease